LSYKLKERAEKHLTYSAEQGPGIASSKGRLGKNHRAKGKVLRECLAELKGGETREKRGEENCL